LRRCLLPSKKSIAGYRRYFIYLLLLFFCDTTVAQTCNVISSIPSITPTSGSFDTLVSATSNDYCTQNARIYNTFTFDEGGYTYTTIPASNTFWINGAGSIGPLNRCGVWGNKNPQTIAFSVCVDVPADKSYYMGFAADNAGTVSIDGVPILENIPYSYWGIYKITLTKGTHFVGFSVLNFDVTTPASIGFEIYDNTEQEILNPAVSYGNLNVIYSTKNDIGTRVQTGDPATSYSCPVGYIVDYCSTITTVPVCSQFVPIKLSVSNPAPACLSDGANITLTQVTAGSSTSLTYSYWQDSLATKPLKNPGMITKSGTYYIMGSANGCYLIKPVTVVINSASTTLDKTICPGENYLGHTANGTYLDTLKAANGCDSVVTINLTVNTTVSLGADRTICAGDSVVLSPGLYSKYLWQDQTTKSQYVVKTPGTYWVTVTDENGCTTSDTVVVKFGGCFDSKIPNTFTPNGDGINDTWNISGLQAFPDCSILIYSRWGQQVFTSIGYSRPWDGTYDGKLLPTGTYYYVINLKNNQPPLSGFVTIIR